MWADSRIFGDLEGKLDDSNVQKLASNLVEHERVSSWYAPGQPGVILGFSVCWRRQA